ncbi:MAG: hypothetical protein ACJ0QE_06405 [Flavobacteriaceae bacterium]|tara:strand:- start:70 stop:1224 length:1155 start_codon:yes stop_codon:yes gene_type:complete
MKVMTLFIDMIRPNRLSIFNDKIKVDTQLDISFKNLGGTVFNNCYTPGPDSPRGISTFLTGLDPYENGCNTRLKWPQFFLKENQKTVFDIFLEKNYKISSFSSPQERANGLFPDHIASLDIHNKNNDLEDYLSTLELEEDHFLFISIPDFHLAFDDFGYNKKGEKDAYSICQSIYDIVFSKFDKNDFDHVFIFSDHGFKFSLERKLEPLEHLINEDRSNVILIHREKYQDALNNNTKLCSLADFFDTYQDILGIKSKTNKSFLSNYEREYIIIEDHLNFEPMINQNIEIWGVVNKKEFYVRTLNKAFLFKKDTHLKVEGIVDYYEDILLRESSFGVYFDEFKKIFMYKKNILHKSVYSNGQKRKSRSRLIILFYSLLDYLKSVK